MAAEEKKIIYRKTGQLLEVGFTSEQIDYLFKGGYLPFKLRSTIRVSLQKCATLLITIQVLNNTFRGGGGGAMTL